MESSEVEEQRGYKMLHSGASATQRRPSFPIPALQQVYRHLVCENVENQIHTNSTQSNQKLLCHFQELAWCSNKNMKLSLL